jgi:hypothetical protein
LLLKVIGLRGRNRATQQIIFTENSSYFAMGICAVVMAAFSACLSHDYRRRSPPKKYHWFQLPAHREDLAKKSS